MREQAEALALDAPPDQARALHALARVDASAAVRVIIAYLCMRVLRECGGAVHAVAADAVRAGTRKLAFCLTEAGSGSDAFTNLTTTASRSGSGWELSGQKSWVAGAGTADEFIVVARTGPHRMRDLSLFLVPAAAPGVRVVARQAFGFQGYPVADVAFEDVALEDARLVGEPGAAAGALAAGLNAERINAAAIACGIADGAMAWVRQALRAHPGLQAVHAQRFLEISALCRGAWLATLKCAGEAGVAGDLPAGVASGIAKLAASRAAVDATTFGMDLQAAADATPEDAAHMEQAYRDCRLYVVGPQPNDVVLDMLAQRWLQLSAQPK